VPECDRKSPSGKVMTWNMVEAPQEKKKSLSQEPMIIYLKEITELSLKYNSRVFNAWW
jgi:hypothetical protein